MPFAEAVRRIFDVGGFSESMPVQMSVIAKEEQFTLKLATLAPEGSTWWDISFFLTFLGT